MNKRLIAPISNVMEKNHWESAMTDEWYKSLLAIQDVVVFSAHKFFHEKGLRHLLAPVTTGSISSPMGLGSDSLPVKVLLNEKEIYLADSMQFALEYGCRLSEKGCYYIMQCFRGEEPDASHLSQFCHVEFEINDTLEKTMHMAWAMVRSVSEAILNEAEAEVLLLAGTTKHIKKVIGLNCPPIISFDDAINMLDQAENDYITLDDGVRTLTKHGEAKLCKLVSDFDVVWVKDMDKLAVPFYQADCPDGTHSIAADLLLGGRETIGSGQRHTTFNELKAALHERQIKEENYLWYLRMKELKPMLTSGMGMGLERYLMWAIQCDDIRNIPIISRANKDDFAL